MSTLDQLQTILSCDNDERISISADETDIPRDILLQSKYSHQSGVIKKLRTSILNHMMQFHTCYQVNLLTILHTYQILEPAIVRLSTSSEDLEKLSMSSLFISLKFKEEFSGSVEVFCQLCSTNFTVTELLSLEKDILVCLDFKFHVRCEI